MEWQVITKEQASELEVLGIVETSEKVWTEHLEAATDKLELSGINYRQSKSTNAYNLSEIAVMLGYTFVKSNVKEAADQLIQEIKVGSCTAKDCNERLREAKSQSF
jgi:hypothetical protein